MIFLLTDVKHEKCVRKTFARIGDYIEVSVEDQGQGIAEEYQSKIFDRFFRIENDTHTIKGTGLGLHLVKISVEKHHGGQVFVHSKLGEGSTFGFRLPINPPKEKTNEENKESNLDEMPIIEENSAITNQQNNSNGWEISFEKH